MIPSKTIVDLSVVYTRYRPDLEASLRQAIPASPDAAELFDLIRYHLGWLDLDLVPSRGRSGKMLRPILCLLSCEAVGASYQRALPAATSLELLHNFSLIHDDVEDHGHARHGRPTLWSQWGEAIAVNAGDALLILSELALLDASSKGLTAEETLRMVRLLNECCLRLTEGQHLDITLESNPELTQEQYFQIISRKTAALLGCSAELGAVSGGAELERSGAFRQFGINLGIGFQIQDDILGIWGESSTTGKPAAADVYGHKVTLPVIDALQAASPADAERIVAVYRSAEPSADEVASTVRLVAELGAKERAEALAASYVDRALAELDRACPEPSPGAELTAVARSLIGRAF